MLLLHSAGGRYGDDPRDRRQSGLDYVAHGATPANCQDGTRLQACLLQHFANRSGQSADSTRTGCIDDGNRLQPELLLQFVHQLVRLDEITDLDSDNPLGACPLQKPRYRRSRNAEPPGDIDLAHFRLVVEFRNGVQHRAAGILVGCGWKRQLAIPFCNMLQAFETQLTPNLLVDAICLEPITTGGCGHG